MSIFYQEYRFDTDGAGANGTKFIFNEEGSISKVVVFFLSILEKIMLDKIKDLI